MGEAEAEGREVLRPGARVHLQEVRDGHPRAWVARLGEVGDDAIEVDLLDPVDDGDLVPGTEIRLTLGTDDGLFLANTTILTRGEDHLVLAAPTTIRTVQRRQHRRTPVAMSLECRRLADSDRSRFDVTTVDLSEGGVRLVAPPGLVVGDVVMLTVVEHADTVAYRGLVVDVRPDPDEGPSEVRVAFSGFNAAMESALGKLLGRAAAGA